MIYNFDYYKQLVSPNMYLCNPNLTPICALNGQNRELTLRFNDLSELTFRVYKSDTTDEKDFNLIATKRLIFIEKIGWFEITNAQEQIEGDSCYKEVTAQSHQVVFKNRGFYSEEKAYMFFNENDPTDRLYDANNIAAMPSVVGQLAQQCGVKLADNLADITPDHDYINWTIIYIDPILKFKAKSFDKMYESNSENNVVRYFKETDTYGYDFIMNEVESAFEVFFEFDYLYHTIKIRTLDDITLPTDIYLSFDNLLRTLKVSEDAEDIVTVLNCNGSDLDITTVNPMGTNYLVDFSYYMQEVDDDGNLYPWMSKELISALEEWKTVWDEKRAPYKELVTQLQAKYSIQAGLNDAIQYANLRVTDLKVAVDQYVSASETDKPNVARLPVTVEEVECGAKSLKSSSVYFSSEFTEYKIIKGYKNIPTSTENLNADGYYEFDYTGDSRTGTAASMIKDYIMPMEENADPEDCYMYFNDGDATTYCKLVIEAYVGVAKDLAPDNVDGITPVATPIDPLGGEGYVEVNGAVLKVVNNMDTIDLYDNSTGTKINSVPNHSNYFEYKNVRHRVELSADRYVTIYCYYVSGFTRHSVYKNLTGNAGWVTLWEDKAQTLCDQNDIVQEDIDDLKDNLAVINEECNIQKFIKRKSEELYDELFHYWIEGTYNNENLAVSTDISIAERIELAEQLLEAGEKELIKSAQPTFTMSAETINFLPLIDFAEFTDQLSLGRTITIEKNEKISYRPALMEISYDLDEGDSFSLTFSSAAKPNSTAMTFAELIKEASDTSRTVTSNWADLTDYAKNKDSITSLVNAPLNRALRSIQAGLSNQAFIIDETGILGRRYKDDSQTSFADEQVRLINNLLVFTDDNWKTVKTALGKTDYGYGLVAEVLIGKLILGDRISIGSNSERVSISDLGIQIKNDAGEIVFNADEEGNLTMSGIIHAEEGGTIGGFISGKHTITTRDSATTYTINQARAIFTPEPYVGLCSDLGADYAIWAGSKEAAKAPFYIKHDGYLYATNARIEGYINASEGYIGGFTVNTEAIFDGTTQENSKIAMRADGKFIAKDAVIEGNGSFDELYVSENFTVKNANIGNLLQANQMSTTKIAFGDGSYVITTGSIDTSGTITARLEVYKKYNGGQPSAPYFKVSLYKSDGSYYYTDVPRSFSCSVTGYLWTTGIKTLTLTVTIPVNSYKAEEIYSTLGNYDLSNPRFDSSQSDVLYFAVGGAAGGFVINCDLLPQKNVQTDLGSPDLRFKRIYCDEIICTKINGKDQS